MINLEKMSANEFQMYLEFAVKNYADAHVKAGNWNEKDAVTKAKEEYERLLPQEEETTDNYFFTIRNENHEVGMIWLSRKSNEKGYIYDINIWKEFQGYGYGKLAMIEVEKVAKSLGLKNIELHVFGYNKVARNLYKKLGYNETSIIMKKTL